MRRMILVGLIVAMVPSTVHARNAAGSIGARNQGASHHANAVARKAGAGVFVPAGVIFVPVPSAPVRTYKLSPLVPYEGDSPEIIDALASKSTEANYRGEMCRILPTHAEQRKCLAHH